MEETEETLDDICRICLKQDGTVINDLEDWLEIIEVISQVQVIFDEGYPEKICNDCVKQLVSANEIRNLIIQNNEYFLKTESDLADFIEREKQMVDDEFGFSESKDLQDYTVMEEIVDNEEDLDFSSIEILENVKLITSLVEHRCCICNEIFTDLQTLENHCADRHKKNIICTDEKIISETQCLVCNRNFNTLDNRNRHRVCMHCDKFFATSETFLIHSKKKICLISTGKVPKSVNTLKVTKQYGCCKCPLTFKNDDACKLHLKEKHSNEVYTGNATGAISCNYCSTPFLLKVDLQKHLKAPRLKIYTCDQCHEQLSSFPKYKHHLETVHSNTKFACEECEKVYDRIESLRYHKYMNHNEKNHHVCPDCGKVFKKKISFTEHRNIHLGIRPHICVVCKSGFTSTGALRTHMRSHTGSKPFQCKFCTKRYSHYSDMKRHSYLHTGNYPFECETCKKGFAKRSAFLTHQGTHENR